jgi:RND family efflux transporter MFP subunit
VYVSAAQPLPFETVQVTAERVPVERVFNAVIEAIHQATVSAQTSGRVIELAVDVDDYVEKGGIIVRFRDTEQRARHSAAEARFKEAEAEYARVSEVYEKKLVAKAALDKAEADLKAARAQLDQAAEELENTVVRAPYSGIVVKRHIEVGELAKVGQPLLTGLSLESLRAATFVPQDVMHAIRAKREARIILDDPAGTRIVAFSLTISPYAEPVTHTFQVRANLPPGQHGVYPGMYVKAAFVTGEQERLLVPRQAIAQRGEVTAVYVLDEQDRVRLRQVRAGRVLADGKVEILAGLEAGARVSLDPLRAAVFMDQQRKGGGP